MFYYLDTKKSRALITRDSGLIYLTFQYFLTAYHSANLYSSFVSLNSVFSPEVTYTFLS